MTQAVNEFMKFLTDGISRGQLCFVGLPSSNIKNGCRQFEESSGDIALMKNRGEDLDDYMNKPRIILVEAPFQGAEFVYFSFPLDTLLVSNVMFSLLKGRNFCSDKLVKGSGFWFISPPSIGSGVCFV